MDNFLFSSLQGKRNWLVNFDERIHLYRLSAILTTVVVLLISISSAAAEQLPFKIPTDSKTLPTSALIETSKGAIEIEFFREDAPTTVANFVHLAATDFYKDVTFHRYVENFVIQGGDPTGTGKGGPGYTLPPEFSKHKHVVGTLAMARLASAVNPERRSNGSQFYICLGAAPHLDGLYTVFARVVNGMDVVEKLRQGDTIVKVLLPK